VLPDAVVGASPKVALANARSGQSPKAAMKKAKTGLNQIDEIRGLKCTQHPLRYTQNAKKDTANSAFFFFLLLSFCFSVNSFPDGPVSALRASAISLGTRIARRLLGPL